MKLSARAIPPEGGAAEDDPGVDTDASAARQIVRDYGAFVWRTLRYQGTAERDLEDVSQEVFIIVFRKLSELERPSSLRAWIYGICVRVAAGYRRRHQTRYEVLVNEVPEDVNGRTSDGREPDRLHARRQLEALIAHLDEDKRAVFVLREVEELSMEEIAEILGCPIGTGYSRLAAAKKQVLSMLSRMNKESR